MAYKNPEDKKAWYQKNKEKVQQKHRAYYEANKDKFRGYEKKRIELKGEEVREYQKKWREENQEKIKAYHGLYYDLNEKEICKRVEKWIQENPEKRSEILRRYRSSPNGKRCRNAARNNRRKAMKHAILDGTWKKECLAIYKEAQEVTARTGIKHEVDHFIPLLGETVCGLHVPWNLVVVASEWNRKKGNRREYWEIFT